MRLIKLILPLLLLCSCQDSTTENPGNLRKKNLTASLLTQLNNKKSFTPEPAKRLPLPKYPWDSHLVGNHPKITKEYFRCKGSALNPPREHGSESLTDCSGTDRHGLPLKERQEFIYPILIDLLNYLQHETSCQVVITSGHRCPTHNTYVDPAKQNLYSKHMIGAEVAFYLRGMEENPEKAVQLLQEYYKNNPKYQSRDFTDFKRYEKSDTNVSIKPWYNKEIYIKLFQPEEGRNFDNRHPYPYLSIMVKWDAEQNERVAYSWQKAQQYLRK